MKNKNPLFPIITDLQYKQLKKINALNEIFIRNIAMRKRFLKMRNETNFSASEVIETIAKDYPYLTFESVYKVVYNKKYF